MKLINKRNEPNDIKINKEQRNKINNGIAPINGINGTKNINGNSVNNNSNNTIDQIEDGNNLSNENKNPNSNNGDENINGNSINGNKKSNERKGVYNKNNAKNKNNEIFPILSLNSLLNCNMNLNEDDINNYIKDKNSNLRVRIRINRCNKITVDRYIQNDNDFNPFNDCYNDVINEYKRYDNITCNYLDNKNFDNLFYSYNFNLAKNLNILYDNEDDSNDINNDIKSFSNSYKQFLKLKKAHSSNN